ncbi:MAG: winged helix DNA-binding domain-containing protein [Pseudomonadota bacterium]|nr:winged helix DNA-binding domain-containing protein [Pseudomonadota bacterium]
MSDVPQRESLTVELKKREQEVQVGLFRVLVPSVEPRAYREAARPTQKPIAAARGVLERLVEAGLFRAHGQARGRTYTLSASVYRKLGQDAGYVRQVGFEPIQQEEMVRRFVREHGSVRRGDVIELCRIGAQQAKRLLARLVATGALERVGAGKGTRYGQGPNI